MSTPLRRDRPLWELWICHDAARHELAVVGKAHHCMVDGVAAVELASLLLDTARRGEPYEPDGWHPQPRPPTQQLLIRGALDLGVFQLGLLRGPLRAVVSPARAARELTAGAVGVSRALSHALLKRAPAGGLLDQQLSPLRRLAWAERPLDDLRVVKHSQGTTVNDVVLAVVAGGMRRYLARHGEHPRTLKAMVPVNVRSPGDVLGNHLSFVFAELPCDEPDPLTRLRRVHAAMDARKRDREPQGADVALKAAEHAPALIQHAVSRLLASPRTFNLVVSNIPGPPGQLYLRGCALRAIYPVVPLADRHTVSIGMTTVGGRACFGVYADREELPDAGTLAMDIDAAVSELLEHAR